MDHNPQSTFLSPFLSHLNSILDETQDQPQDISTEWAKFPITDSRQSLDDVYTNSSGDTYHELTLRITPDSMVVMGDYLIIIASDSIETEHARDVYERIPCYKHLWAVDLRDMSFQEVQIKETKEELSANKYTLRKYKDNQIIAFGIFKRAKIYIKSFQPFSVKWRWKENKIGNRHAQIYNDGFYTFDYDSPLNTLWRFDFKNQTWKDYKTVGGDPGLNEIRNSFIFKDNLYVSGGHLSRNSYRVVPEKAIFMLNFETMEWRKFEQHEYYIDKNYDTVGEIYKEHLMILCNNDELHFWNIQANSWKTFNIKDPGFSPNCNMVVYKNSLLIAGESEGEICLATYNLDSLGLEIPLSPEQEHLRTLFLSEKDSDIKLKIQGEVIAAHKEVLINKSRFFAGGMTETKQDVIEIEDCDFVVFKEFIRFIYYNRFYLNEELLAIQLINLADKYLQDDLKKSCADYLDTKINSETVLPIFEVAYAKNLEDLMTSCVSHLTHNIKLTNIAKIVECLITKQNDYPRDLRDAVLDWIIEKYFEIYKKLYQSLRLCEDFLIKNIEMKTIVRISWFIDKYSEDAFFEKETMRSRDALYCFVQENFQELRKEPIASSLASRFLMDMMAYIFMPNENKSKFDKENEEEKNLKDEAAGEGKRMEPSQKDCELDENPELKKTKK